MATKTKVKYPCASCGKHAPAEQMVFSRHTGKRYCIDMRACRTRAKRNARGAA